MPEDGAGAAQLLADGEADAAWLDDPDWPLREGALERIQKPLVAMGAVLYPEPLEDDLLIDTSLYLEAVEG